MFADLAGMNRRDAYTSVFRSVKKKPEPARARARAVPASYLKYELHNKFLPGQARLP